jgi:hypothetical protein
VLSFLATTQTTDLMAQFYQRVKTEFELNPNLTCAVSQGSFCDMKLLSALLLFQAAPLWAGGEETCGGTMAAVAEKKLSVSAAKTVSQKVNALAQTIRNSTKMTRALAKSVTDLLALLELDEFLHTPGGDFADRIEIAIADKLVKLAMAKELQNAPQDLIVLTESQSEMIANKGLEFPEIALECARILVLGAPHATLPLVELLVSLEDATRPEGAASIGEMDRLKSLALGQPALVGYADRTRYQLRLLKGTTQRLDANEDDSDGDWEAEMENAFTGRVRRANGSKK